MFRFRKVFRNSKFRFLKTKIFIILFALFFSSLALAAALTVTNDRDDRIPPGDANCSSSDLGSGTHVLNNDRTENPLDVAFSDDGSKVFTVNSHMQGTLNLSMNTLSIGFELNAVDTSEEIGGNNNGKGCDAVDGFDHRDVDGVAAGSALIDINIVDGGNAFFLLTGQQGDTSHDNSGRGGQPAELLKFNLSTPNDFATASFDREHDFSASIASVSFSRDGTKLFALEDTNNTPNLTTFSLPSAFDISSLTQIHTVDLSSAYDFMNEDGDNKNAVDIEFNDNGSAMFVMMNNDRETGRDLSYIYQFRLGTNYDVSSATLVGKWNITFANTSTGYGMPQGFTFSSDGMKMFIVQIQSSAGVDEINSYSLECPYGLVECSSDSTSSIGSQVELSKQNISLNVSTIFKRFEWIKRNRNNNNLNNLNASIKFDNPMLNYWVKKLPTKIVSINGPVENGQSITIGSENKNSNNLNNFTTTIKSDNPLLSSWMNKLPKNITALKASLKEKSEKDKKSKWSYWSLGDLSLNSYDKHGFEKAKDIKTKGLTFGADRKFRDNKFLGLALRYGGNKSNISASKHDTDMESLTLNIYGIIPVNENQYINAVVGLSGLRFDNKYLGKLSGERNGKQAFTSINYRTKKNYGKFNITPTGKLTYGVTRLSEFTDFLSNTIDSPTTDVIYEEDTFASGEFSAGFLFEMDKIKNDQGTLQAMGGIEILYDLSSDVDYKYKYVGSADVNKDTILGKYSKRSLKTGIGFEMIYLNGFTISPVYERIISLSNDNNEKPFTERFIIKFSRSKEEDNSKFALDFDPLSDNPANLSYVKDVSGFDVKVSSNYSLMSQIPDYGATIEVSRAF